MQSQKRLPTHTFPIFHQKPFGSENTFDKELFPPVSTHHHASKTNNININIFIFPKINILPTQFHLVCIFGIQLQGTLLYNSHSRCCNAKFMSICFIVLFCLAFPTISSWSSYEHCSQGGLSTKYLRHFCLLGYFLFAYLTEV